MGRSYSRIVRQDIVAILAPQGLYDAFLRWRGVREPSWNDTAAAGALIERFQRIVKSFEPQILAELDRMEQSGAVTRYIDPDKIRRLLAARDVDDHNSGWEQETQAAAMGFAVARFVERFRGYN